METRPERPIIGIAWMALAGVAFVALTAGVKHVGSELPVVQTAFLRFFFGIFFMAPAIVSLIRDPIPGSVLRFAGLRGLAHVVAVCFWFYAMTQITVAEVVSLNYLAPVYVTLGAAVFLGEKLTVGRILAVFVALIGAAVILRPGFRELSLGHSAILITSIFLGISYVMAKRLSGLIEAGQTVALLTVTVTLLLAPAALWVWETPSLSELGWTILIAGMASFGHYAMTRSFAEAPAGVVQPASFLQLVWAVLIGWAFFNERIDIWVILGGALILASVSAIALHEASRRRNTLRAPSP